MGILDAIKSCLVTNSFEDKVMKRIDKPTFYKDFSKEDIHINELQHTLETIKDDNKKKSIEKELYMLRSSLEGQSKVYYELKNTSFPFICLWNLRLEYNDKVANIDFILVTHKFCCILKSKNISGSIEIDSKGNFNRWLRRDDKWIKEGMYNPVEENRKSEKLIKNVLADKLNINNIPIYTLVVFTNDKTTINTKECPKEIEKQVIRYDALNNALKEILVAAKYNNDNEQIAFDIAEYFKKMNSSMDNAKIKKYVEVKTEKKLENPASIRQAKEVFSKEFISKALKDYRLHISKENNIPPYYVFNNEEMDRLLEVMPKSKEQLKKVRGFGDYKVDRFGEDILRILNA